MITIIAFPIVKRCVMGVREFSKATYFVRLNLNYKFYDYL
jgi:hypothetical protein